MSTVDVPGATPTVEADSGHAAEMVQLANATFLAQALYVAAELNQSQGETHMRPAYDHVGSIVALV